MGEWANDISGLSFAVCSLAILFYWPYAFTFYLLGLNPKFMQKGSLV